jgi:hypothetical protein
MTFTIACVYGPAFSWVLSAFQDNINGNSIVILGGVTVCAAAPLCTIWLFRDSVRRVFENPGRRRVSVLSAVAAAASPLIAGTMLWLTLFSAFLAPDQAFGLGYPARLAGLIVASPTAYGFTLVNWSQALRPTQAATTG